ncbi:MAG TPA: hypothetical protein VFS21_07410 [Roseiflexaceae bacterium]|nr:hypothetical protein [Roseiflexaceae bacterium]
MVHMTRRWYVRRALALLVVLVFSAALPPQGRSTALAQEVELRTILHGSSYATSGGNILYVLEVQNLTDEAITDLLVYDPIPEHTTHQIGGTYNAAEHRVEFTLDSLPPRGKHDFSVVVHVANGLAPGTRIENHGAEVTYTVGDGEQYTLRFPGFVTRIEAPGELVASYTNADGRSFDVIVDGYSFLNYGGEPWEADDLGVDDLLLLFGPQICVSGTTAANCKLSQPAEDWRKKMLEYMKGGHCDGLAITSLRFFNQLPFKNKTLPSDYEATAQHTNNLVIPMQSVENYIAYYWTTQMVAPPSVTGTPVEIVDRLITDFSQEPPRGYAVHFHKAFGEPEGHSVAAYGVESVGSDESRILIYDNNFPDQRQYITVDRVNNTWIYETAATPGQPTDVYSGTATTANLELSPLSGRERPAGEYFECPFCPEPEVQTQDASPDQVSGEIQFQYTGEGSLLVVNDEGQATGDDLNTETFVDTIPGAEVDHFLGGLGKAIPPRIIVPFSEQDETYYTAYVHGKTYDSATTGSLMINGAGFTMGVNDLDLDAEEQFEFQLSPDGDYIAFKSTQTIVAPDIYITYDPVVEGDPSISFEISGVTVQAGETISLELDPALERVYFDSTGLQEEEFLVTMSMVWPDGDTDEYSETVDMSAGATTAFIDFGAWDGLLDPPTYVDDILQNPSVNHRLKLTGAAGSYNVTPQPNAPAGVYTLRATFTNVTEISLEQLSFTVADLGVGNKLLDAAGGPAGVGAQLVVPAEALGTDGVLSPNESFTLSFRVGLAQAGTSGLTVDALGAPRDWLDPEPAPTYDANNASFAFGVRSSNSLFLPAVRR